MTYKNSFVLLLSLALLAGLAGCGAPTSAEAIAARKKTAALNYAAGKEIVLTVVWNEAKGAFLSGAILAAEELNAEGGVEGRRIRLEFVDESVFLKNKGVKRTAAEGRYRNALQEAGRRIAHTVIANPDTMAVIGHSDSAATMAAMLAYEDNGILFLAGGTTQPIIKWSAKNLYFQLLPHDEVMAKAMAEKIHARKWDRVYFVYEVHRHNEQIIELIKNDFSDVGIQVAGSIAILPMVENDPESNLRMENALNVLQDKSVDAVVLVTSPELGAKVIDYARSLTILKPFIGVSALDAPSFRDAVGEAGIGTRIVSLRNEDYQFDQFAQKFKARFSEVELDTPAAIGYDSVRLYAQAVASAQSTDPYLVSHSLSYDMPYWYGLLGTYSFVDGVATGLNFYIQRLARDKNDKLFFEADNSLK
jgi:branched-chain amino acid transport system substrate-binding protein